MAEQLPIQFEFRANQTFNDFFLGVNQDVVTHLQRCVDGSGEPQIFLWAAQGLGKTHLLNACCRYAQQQRLSPFYFDLKKAEQSQSELLDGLDNFDLVCFDNLEYMVGKPDWELAFFHFFNQHRDRGHRLILTACSAPNELNIQLPDLKTRLNWGLTLKIKPLSDDDNMALLTFKARQLGFEISPQAGRFLLLHFARDLSSLWVLLEKLDRASLAAKRKLTIPFLKEFFLQHSENNTHQ